MLFQNEASNSLILFNFQVNSLPLTKCAKDFFISRSSLGRKGKENETYKSDSIDKKQRKLFCYFVNSAS